MAALSEQLKEKGNRHYRLQEFDAAISYYSQAIQKNPTNPLLFTNRANARLKLERWEEVIDDCLKSIEILRDNMKGFFFLGQAQLALNHPNEALSSALMAYELCTKSATQTTSAFSISEFVVKCKRAKWEMRERERLRRRSGLLLELEDGLKQSERDELSSIQQRYDAGEIGEVAVKEETEAAMENAKLKLEELRNTFAISDPANLTPREVPSYLVDDISFEIMSDPVITKHGHSYERATIVEHLKRNPIDPLTREPLTVGDLRPNLALRQACREFWETNSGWAYEW